MKPATLLKVTLFHGCFSRFLDCTNGTKSRNASHLFLFNISSKGNKAHWLLDVGPVLGLEDFSCNRNSNLSAPTESIIMLSIYKT